MCRSSNFEYHHLHHEEAASDPSALTTITGFYVRLCTDQSSCPFPDSLTLLLLSPAPPTISLHRIHLPTDNHFIVFASTKHQPSVRVPTTQPLSFQLYLGESMLLKGAILIKKKSQNHSLKLELCKTNSVSEVELWVAFDGHVAVGDKVTLEKPIPLWRRSNKRDRAKLLEDIPEEETEYEEITEEEEEEEEGAIEELEMDLEVLRKAMDMGIWALCLGLGFVVSKASLTNFRPPSTFS